MDEQFKSAGTATKSQEELEMDVGLDSPAIRRLVEEVRAEEDGVPRSYNRTFNRHNR
ncbi:hypothetical protein NKG95_02795 [Mesorhizobium sp. M1423]|uniref:YhhA family cyclophane-containing RiPP n=1 Tax=unclassified Mesorhizobium TaxID=325217 RepID=UPI0025EF6C58|nr:YhhA family cyclophane-containing RiPP [Mesorhizobium sp.]